MKVLIACEFSGIVRDAFAAKGHDAWSCDLLPTDTPGNHIQGDVLEILNDGWDLMIAHPPCTYLSYAGTRHWNTPNRLEKRLEALQFFAALWLANVEMICIENPKGCASPTIAKYSQEIQPFYFGESEYKTTWLWLRNLSNLIHVKQDTFFEAATHSERPKGTGIWKNGKIKQWTERQTDSKIRSKTFGGIAKAMAKQWG